MKTRNFSLARCFSVWRLPRRERTSPLMTASLPILPAIPADPDRGPAPVTSERVLGVPLALTDYERTLDWIDASVAVRAPGYVCVAAVHTVMAFQEDPELRAAVLGSDLTVPDGQPLVWAMNLLGHSLPSRVYGPDLLKKACERGAHAGQRFFLYGGRREALSELRKALPARYPGLEVVGATEAPFRALTPEEAAQTATEINAAERGCGLGGPRRPVAGEVDGRHA